MVNDSQLDLSTEFAVVADIGGTNARFGRINLKTFELDRIQVFPCEFAFKQIHFLNLPFYLCLNIKLSGFNYP